MRTRWLLSVLVLAQCVLAPLELRAQSVIRHVVMIVQENRTPDNLFHGFPGADTVNTGQNSKGEIITLKAVPLATSYDVYHGHKSFVQMFDNGKMDGADLIKTKCGVRKPHDCKIPPNPQFKYVQTSDVQPYFDLGQQYTFADRMFSTMQSSSYPAHQFIISGTSAPTPDSDLFMSESPSGYPNASMNAGCDAPPSVTVALIDPTGDESQRMYPCFEHLTLMDTLNARGISWRYYSYGSGSIWTGPNSILHLRWGPDWSKNVVLDPPQILTDIAAGNLAQVSWIIPKGRYGDHSGGNDGSGPSWVASIVNAIGTSQYWSDTAIFVFWDDWGGWYDHVAPKIINSFEYGFRVPLIVVSPYAKKGYVSHEMHHFGSILKFIENVYSLPSLGYSDANADDLSDCFNFGQAPSKFSKIKAPIGPDFFIKDTRPGWDPDDE